MSELRGRQTLQTKHNQVLDLAYKLMMSVYGKALWVQQDVSGLVSPALRCRFVPTTTPDDPNSTSRAICSERNQA